MVASVRAVALITGMLVFGGALQAAQALGTTRVQQTDGVVREYHNVTIRLIDHRGVRITSADGKGTLFVSKGACSYVGELERCLPYAIVLDQGGMKHPIDFQRGTEYVNRTDAPQPLRRSSEHVPPHGILLLMLTAHGTYITVRGTFDGANG